MAHNHKVVIGAADLVANLRFSVRDDIAIATEVRDELEQVLDDLLFFAHTPFQRVSLMLHYGLKCDDQPSYGTIDSSGEYLDISIEIDARDLIDANRREFKRQLWIAALKAAIDVARKYGVPPDNLERMLLSELGQV